MPDKIRIRTGWIRAAMTALCRTDSPEPVENRPCFPQGVTVPVTEIVPDLIQAFSGHEEPFGVFKEGNIPHLCGVLTGSSYRDSPEKQILKQILK
jgi:hypothetical protein